MENQQTTAVVKQEPRAPVIAGPRGLVISDMDGLWRFASYVAASGLAPKGIQTKEAIFVAVQMGLEVGLTPMAALQNIAVINGRPTLWGDAQLAVVRSTGELEVFEEWYEAKGKRLTRNPSDFSDDTTAVCKVKRAGYAASETAFSVSDAKAAQLWGKQGPWSQYPARMLRMRARSFALRDQFGDALRGFRSVEEAGDEPRIETHVAPAPSFLPSTVEATPVASEAAQARSVEPPAANPVAAVPAGTDPADGPVRQLEELATGLGATFEDFRAFAAEPFPDSSSWGSWSEVSNECASACLRARGRFTAKLTAIVEARKGAK